MEIKELSQQEIKEIRFLDGICFYAPNKTIKEAIAEEKEREQLEEKEAIRNNTFDNPILRLEIE